MLRSAIPLPNERPSDRFSQGYAVSGAILVTEVFTPVATRCTASRHGLLAKPVPPASRDPGREYDSRVPSGDREYPLRPLTAEWIEPNCHCMEYVGEGAYRDAMPASTAVLIISMDCCVLFDSPREREPEPLLGESRPTTASGNKAVDSFA